MGDSVALLLYDRRDCSTSSRRFAPSNSSRLSLRPASDVSMAACYTDRGKKVSRGTRRVIASVLDLATIDHVLERYYTMVVRTYSRSVVVRLHPAAAAGHVRLAPKRYVSRMASSPSSSSSSSLPSPSSTSSPPTPSSPHRDNDKDGNDDPLRDAILLNAVRLARAECDLSTQRLKRKLLQHGIIEPSGLDDVCARFVDLESVLTGAMGSQMPIDSSGDDMRLRPGAPPPGQPSARE